jgi:molybdopterin-dependent oxidoreductase alpha subunit
MKPIVGGGPKKVLYTLNTVRRIGLKNSAKALTANNTCKACGLGMGGQQGGMTNELGEYPSVCNKSVQAQSTDIQPPIPHEIFSHTIDELKELSAHELEHLGRLDTPLYKAAGQNTFTPCDWDWAINRATESFKQSTAESSFFYSSGRSSNEAGFVLQLLARLYGTNNVNNCSYYCHQATSVGLDSTIGTGTATVELDDLTHCDLVFVIGANPSSNHPRFIHKLKACRERGGKVIVINPAKEPGLVRFSVPKSPVSMIAGGTEIASDYLQPNIGSDLALFKGIAKAVLELGGDDKTFIKEYCENYEDFKNDIDTTDWENIESITGINRQRITQVASDYCSAKKAVFSWGMGMTHHQFGVQNVEYIANLALLRGMIGKQGAGLLPLRGHSNVQGIGTIGVKPVLAQEVFSQLETTLDIKLPTTKGLDTYHALAAAADERINNALIVGGNLFSASPDSSWAESALNKIDFKLFLTTTLNKGHLHGIDDGETIIVPVMARDEETQSTTQESMFNYVRLSDGGIDRIDGARSEVDILASIGTDLIPESTFDFSVFKSHQNIREAIANCVPGLEQLKDIGIAKKEFHVQGRLMHEPAFKTPSLKAQFIVRDIPSNGKQQAFPFLLSTIRSEGQFNSIIYEEKDSYRYNAPRNAILMSPDDLQQLDIEHGDNITVKSKTGTFNNAVAHSFDLPKGNIMAYYPEANILSAGDLDPRSLTPNFKSIPVAVEKHS